MLKALLVEIYLKEKGVGGSNFCNLTESYNKYCQISPLHFTRFLHKKKPCVVYAAHWETPSSFLKILALKNASEGFAIFANKNNWGFKSELFKFT